MIPRVEYTAQADLLPTDLHLVSDFVEEYHQEIKNRFGEFLQRHGGFIDSENTHLIQGRAPETIETFVREKSVDLVVMGTVSRTGLSGLLIGNTAQQILDRIECSVLAVKPDNFICPIQLP